MNLDIEWWAKNFGWPGVIFITAVFTIWRFWEFMKPFISDYAAAQVHLTRAATTAIEALPTATQVDGVHKKIDEVLIRQGSHGNILVEIHEAVVTRKTA